MTEKAPVSLISNLKNSDELQKEYKLRIKKNTEIEIPVDATTREIVEKKYGAENCSLIKTRNVFKCKTVKEEWKIFEDRVWSILYKMGFSVLNEGECKISMEDGSHPTQIDVLAKTDNIVCVIECKDTSKDKRPVKECLNKFAGIKSGWSASILKSFPNEKIELRWILATSFTNYEAGAEDLAKQHGIWLINNWDYYEKLIGVLGNAAKYQFLANLMKEREIPGMSPVVYALKGTMAKLPYYLFSISPNDLMKISFVPHAGSESDANLELYQRLVKPGRVNDIKKYIKGAATNPDGITVNGLFPTNIVVNFRSKKQIRFDQLKGDKEPKPGYLYIPNYYGSAEIIDGQHRLFSFAGLEESKTETVSVIAFENLEASQKADIFYHINGKQEKVTKNLINQILCVQDWKSKNENDRLYALPLKVIMDLNEDSNSVLRNKIKMENGNLTGTITMTYAEVSDNFSKLKFFSKDKTRRKSNSKPVYHQLFYKTFEDTLRQTKTLLNNYFSYYLSHSSRMNDDWNSGDKSHFDRNGVIVPLLMVLKNIVDYLFSKEDMVNRTNVPLKDYVDKINEFQDIVCKYFDEMSDDELSYFLHAPGGKGYSERHDLIIEAINKEKPDFMKERVEELKRRREEASTTPNNDVRKIIGEFENKMKFVFTRTLMEHYGPTWIRDGVPKKVRDGALSRNADDGITNLDYLLKGSNIIDLKDIFYFKDNYGLLDWIVVHDSNPTIKKSDRANWLATLNTYRNDIMHNKVRDGSNDFITREQYIKDKLEIIEPLFDRYIESNNLEKEWSDYENLEYPE